jgi:hypothetical protein
MSETASFDQALETIYVVPMGIRITRIKRRRM